MNNQSITAAIATILITVIAATTIIPSTAFANMQGWTDSVINSIQTTDSTIYEGQRRNYFVGGTFKAKFTPVDDPLLTFKGPSLKAGCGGIEGRLGAFSYLNFDQLVAKLQMIMSAAPTFAFNLALKTLCEACENIISALEGIVQAMNQFNINSCNAAKALGGYAGNLLGKAIGGGLAWNPKAESWYKDLIGGLNDSSNTIKTWVQDWAGYYDCMMVANQSERATCEKRVGRFLFTSPLWNVVFGSMPKVTSDLRPLFSGWFGDFKHIEPADTDEDPAGGKSFGIPLDEKIACDKESLTLLDAIVDGGGPEREGFTDNCTKAPSSSGLATKVGDSIDRIEQNILGNTQPLEEDKSLISVSPVPLYSMLSLAATLDKINSGNNPEEYYMSKSLTKKLKGYLPYMIGQQVMQMALSQVTAWLTNQMARMQSDALSTAMIAVLQSMQIQLHKAMDESNQKYADQKAEWELSFKSATDLNQKMKAEIYSNLSRTKLLDSYQFSKGMR